jgi:hypothetical protein
LEGNGNEEGSDEDRILEPVVLREGGSVSNGTKSVFVVLGFVALVASLYFLGRLGIHVYEARSNHDKVVSWVEAGKLVRDGDVARIFVVETTTTPRATITMRDGATYRTVEPAEGAMESLLKECGKLGKVDLDVLIK